MRIAAADAQVIPKGYLVEPIRGECLRSYLDRLSYANHVPIGELLQRLGLTTGSRLGDFIRGYGIALDQDPLHRLATILQLDPLAVEAMTLRTYDGTALDLSNLDSADPDSRRIAALHNWVSFNASPCCPQCLRTNFGAWMLRWRLPWFSICLRHRLVLVDTCPRCDKPIRFGRQDGTLGPPHLGRVATPTLCSNSLRPAGRGRSDVCGFDLTTLACRRPTRAEYLGATALQSAVARNTARLAGTVITGRETLAATRALTVLYTRCAEAGDLHGCHPKAIAAALTYTDACQQARAQRRRVRAASRVPPLTEARVALMTAATRTLDLRPATATKCDDASDVGERLVILLHRSGRQPSWLQYETSIPQFVVDLAQTASTTRPTRRRRWNKEETKVAVADFLRWSINDETAPGPHRYDEWQTTRFRSTPTRTTILRYWDRWDAVTTAAAADSNLDAPQRQPRWNGDLDVFREALQRAAGDRSAITRAQYTHWARGRTRDDPRPDASVIIEAFGTWRSACTAAELELAPVPGETGFEVSWRYRDDELLACLKRAANHSGEPLTGSRYEAWARAAAPGERRANRSAVVARFGSWTAACIAASVQPGERGGTAKRWTREQIDTILRDFLNDCRALEQRPTLTEYDRWRTRHPNAPSTIAFTRERSGWSTAIERVQERHNSTRP